MYAQHATHRVTYKVHHHLTRVSTFLRFSLNPPATAAFCCPSPDGVVRALRAAKTNPVGSFVWNVSCAAAATCTGCDVTTGCGYRSNFFIAKHSDNVFYFSITTLHILPYTAAAARGLDPVQSNYISVLRGKPFSPTDKTRAAPPPSSVFGARVRRSTAPRRRRSVTLLK